MLLCSTESEPDGVSVVLEQYINVSKLCLVPSMRISVCILYTLILIDWQVASYYILGTGWTKRTRHAPYGT